MSYDVTGIVVRPKRNEKIKKNLEQTFILHTQLLIHELSIQKMHSQGCNYT